MKLLAKFNLIFLAVFAVGLAVAAYVSKSFLQHNAREQVIEQANLMMETAMSTRHYTEQQIRPLLKRDDTKKVFHRETVPAFAAQTAFQFLHSKYPDYSYKEAALNPTNPTDRASDWEADIINTFRNDSSQTQLIGNRDTPTGPALYLAKPFKTVASCAECHSTPAVAPPSMLHDYGSNNGFGWKTGEIIGAQIVSVPMALPFRLAEAAFRTLMASLAGVALFMILALNLVLIMAVIRPVSRLSASADEISKGNLDVPELPVQGKDEVAVLADSFNRMHRSLVKAVKMLEAE